MELQVFAEYLNKISDLGQRARTEEVLDWVAGHFDALSPRIAWNQPIFTAHGTYIIGFSVAKTHLAVSPEAEGIARFSEEIVRAGYGHGSNLFRIKWSQDVDYPLIERMIRFNLSEKADCTTFWRPQK